MGWFSRCKNGIDLVDRARHFPAPGGSSKRRFLTDAVASSIMKVVFHLSAGGEGRRRMVVNNMTNLLEDETVEIEELALVTNSAGIDLLTASGRFSAQIDALAEQGAQFKVCGNSLWQSEYDESELHPESEVVSSGVGELGRLQERGYEYIKP